MSRLSPQIFTSGLVNSYELCERNSAGAGRGGFGEGHPATRTSTYVLEDFPPDERAFGVNPGSEEEIMKLLKLFQYAGIIAFVALTSFVHAQVYTQLHN